MLSFFESERRLWQQRILANPNREQDHRSPFVRDRSRILHSAAFRCLQGKTQIHAVGENDFYRTRLTHSLEVAQIGSSLTAQLRYPETWKDLTRLIAYPFIEKFQQQLKGLLPSTPLIEAICYAHDIGHPPFGHGGEIALNYMMQCHGGFEGNAQTFRILTKLEPYTETTGMNLTRRTLLGVLKYPAILSEASPQYAEISTSELQNAHYIRVHDWQPGKGIFMDDKDRFNWLLAPLTKQDRQQFTQFRSARHQPNQTLKTLYKSLDCSIMELADDIAYGVHDLEDAISMGLVNPYQWESAKERLKQCGSLWLTNHIEKLSQQLFSIHPYKRKNAIGALVNFFIVNVCWKKIEGFQSPLLAYNAQLSEEAINALTVFKQFVFNYVISDTHTQRVEYKGQRVLIELFNSLASDPIRLLPPNQVKLFKQAQTAQQQNRIICDYVASMSDGQALRLYQLLLG